jgi:hypothetical protein
MSSVEIPPPPTDEDASDLQRGPVNEVDHQPPGLPDIGTEPRFDDNHTARRRMADEGIDRLLQTIHRSDIADGAAETENSIETSTEIEGNQIGLMKRSAG